MESYLQSSANTHISVEYSFCPFSFNPCQVYREEMVLSERSESMADEVDPTIFEMNQRCDQEDVKFREEEGPRPATGEGLEMLSEGEQCNGSNTRSMDFDGKVLESVAGSWVARSTSAEYCLDKGDITDFVRIDSELSNNMKSSDEEYGKDRKRRRCPVELREEDEKGKGYRESNKRPKRDPGKLERSLERWERNGSGKRPPRYPRRGFMRVSGISVEQYLRVIGVKRR